MMTKFPTRTEEDKAQHAALLPRLMAGESSVRLSAESGVSVSKLRNWKSREVKKQEKEEKREQRQALKPPVDTVSQGLDTLQKASQQEQKTPDTVVQNISVKQVEHLRSFLGDQALTAMGAISLIRSKVPETLHDLNDLILQLISSLQETLASGEGIKTATYQGEIIWKSLPLTISEHATIANTIKMLRYEHAALNNLPSEPLKIAALETNTKQLAAAQHLHLHSYGSKSITPVAVRIEQEEEQAEQPIEAIDVTPEPASDGLEDWQRELISS